MWWKWLRHLTIVVQVRTLIVHYNNRQVQAVIELKNKSVLLVISLEILHM